MKGDLGNKAKRIVFLLKLLLAAALIIFLTRSGTFDRAFWQLVSFQKAPFIALSVLMLVVTQLLLALRTLVLQRYFIPGLRFWTVFRINYIGYFFNNFLPGSCGGDIARAYYFARYDSTTGARNAGAVVIDRLAGVTALVILVFLLSITSLKTLDRYILSCVLIISAAIGLFVVVVLYRTDWKISKWEKRGVPAYILPVIRMFEAMPMLVKKKNLFLLALAISILGHLAAITAVYSIAQIYLASAGFFRTYQFIALVMFLALIPITPGNIGWIEFVSAELWLVEGMDFGAHLFLVYRIIAAMVSFPGLIFFLVYRRSGNSDGVLQKEAGSPPGSR